MTSKACAAFTTVFLCAFLGMAQTPPKTGPVNIDEAMRDPVKPDKGQAYYHYAAGKLLEKERNLDRAEQEMRDALALDPTSSVLRSEIAEFYLRARKIDQAITLCKEAIALDKDNADAHYLLGHVYSFMVGQPDVSITTDDVINEFTEVVRIDPKHPAAQMRLGQIYLRNQKPDKAIEALEGFNKQTGGNDESFYFLALAYESVDKIEEAIAAVKGAVEIQPTSRNVGFLGTLLTKAGRGKEAVDLYRKLLGEEGNNLEIKKQLAATLLRNNEFEEAITLLEEIAAQDSDDLSIRMQLGQAYMSQHKFDKALQAFEAGLKLDPSNKLAKFYLAAARKEKGDVDQALADFKKLMDETYKPTGKYNPEDFELRVLVQKNIGFIYQDAGDLDKAIEEFRGILTMEDKPENYGALINALRLAKKNAEALKLTQEALKKNPQDKFLARTNSQLVAEVEGFDKGEKLAQELIQQNPKDLDYYLSYSQICLQARRYDQAEDALKKGMEISGGNEVLKFQLGAVYERAKRFDKAEELFKEIIEKNPSNANALNYLGYMWADQGVHLQEALAHIKKAIELDPNNGAYLDSLGWVYFKLDRFQEAEQYLAEAIKLVKNDPTIHEHLGDLYFKSGQFAKAEGAWQMAVDNGTEPEEINKVKDKLKHLKKK